MKLNQRFFVTKAGKYSLVLILFIICLSLFVYAEEITFRPQQLINISTVQCFNLNNSVCSESIPCNVTIQNTTGGFLFLNESMFILPNGFRGFNTGLTFATETTLSAVTSCDNGGTEPFLIKIRFDEDLINLTQWLIGFILGTASIFFILGLKKDRFIYRTFSGFFLMLIGMEVMLRGFPNISNAFITESSGIVLIGLGAAFILFGVSEIGELK